MMRGLVILAAGVMLALPASARAPDPWAMPGEEAVDPYTVSDANAGAAPIEDPKVFAAFGGREGLTRIVDTFVELNYADPRINEIFKPFEKARLKRTLFEQFCYILGGGCAYTGRDMASSHKDMGLTASDMNALVENLQVAMTREGVPFPMQNRLLARLAPMKRDVLQK